MKNMQTLILAILAVLVIAVCSAGCAETVPTVRIVSAVYDGLALRGSIDAPEGTYYARVTVCLPDGVFYALILPIGPDGTFGLDMAANCEYIGIEIVDTPEALVPGDWTYYDTAPVVMM